MATHYDRRTPVKKTARAIRWSTRFAVMFTALAVIFVPATSYAAPGPESSVTTPRAAAAASARAAVASLPGQAPPSGWNAAGKATGSDDDDEFDDDRWGDRDADEKSKDKSGKNAASADPGSLYTIGNAIGARSVWQRKDSKQRQITGQGVAVALLDSGVAAVPGLSDPGKVVQGPDLSIEANGPLTLQDTYGHGTHLAGIIAAEDTPLRSPSDIQDLSPTTQLGIAPDATIESIKLATTDGSTDVSQVIAALNWITEHQSLADGTKVRVVTLAFGTDSVQPYDIDPLAAAAENAWRHGLVVVVSGGNEGPDAHSLTNPAIDPYVIAVGASDPGGSVAGWANPGVATFSSSGTAARHVDVLAPGRSIVSMRAPGSYIDTNHPEGRVSGDDTDRLFRGSGTSQAAAVVSGAAALLLQAYPDLTPDEVKAALVATARPVEASPLLAGAGQIDVAAALGAIAKAKSSKYYESWMVRQNWPVSTGQGSLDAARGGQYLVDADGELLSGEVDIQGSDWDPASWWAAASRLTSWNGGEWNGEVWTGSDWTGNLLSARWSSARWSSARWSATVWESARWSSARWSSARWSAGTWDSARWSGLRWD